MNINIEDVLKRTFSNVNDLYKAIGENLTIEERKVIWNKLSNRSCLNCINGSCRVSYNEKVSYDGKKEGQSA